ncbi:MAG: hypothetical protein DCF32_00055 [Leptolyngbya sp.]|nr:MAG: hypothetical protein DCF32_00055 [Leptolyngbya sp.]
MEPTGRGKNDYPVYNHKERPGIGRDALSNFQYNCFWVSLEEQNSEYLPFTFNDFINQFNRYHQDTCSNCVRNGKIFTFDDVDRAAVDLKFSQKGVWHESEQEVEQEIQETRANYYYCPLISEILSNSELEALQKSASRSKDTLPSVEPITSILGISDDGRYSNAWDDEYIFKILSNKSPISFGSVCSIYQQITSEKFMPQNAEKTFFKLYMLSALEKLNEFSISPEGLYLEDKDFQYDDSKFFDFLFPIPQTWVYVIPKPPPGTNWKEFEGNSSQAIPQRVDFMLTYEGERHIIEMDGSTHYSSEAAYRKTLSDTRWLRRCGFKVHRFANREITELDSLHSGPNLKGFKDLLYSEGLDFDKLVLVKTKLRNI